MDTLHATARLRRKFLVLALGTALAMSAAPSMARSLPAAQGAFADGRAFELGFPASTPSWLERVRALKGGTRGGPSAPVTNCDDSGPGSLRDVIATAPEFAVVDLSTLACSSISLSTGEIAVPQKNLYIVGPGRDALTIDAGGAGRAFNLQHKYESADPGGITISSLTIANGRSEVSGGCISAGGNLALDDVRLHDCHVHSPSGAATGGAIFAWGNVQMASSIVSGNTASGAGGTSGGAVWTSKYAVAYESTLGHNTVTSSTGSAYGGAIAASAAYAYGSRIHGNAVIASDGVAMGGGIAMFGSTDTASSPPASYLIFSTLADNRAEGAAGAYGGALQAGSATGADLALAGVRILGSTINGNRATSACTSCDVAGGGVNVVGLAQIGFSTVRDNVAELTVSSSGAARGGGLASAPELAAPTVGLMLFRSTLSGNRAASMAGRGLGGGMAAGNYGMQIQLSTIAGNFASLAGGGLYVPDTLVVARLDGTIIAGNQAVLGDDLGAPAAISLTGGYNLVMNADPVLALPPDTSMADPLLLPLANYGGPTATHALAACSPAIDAIPMERRDLAGGPDSDQRLAPYVGVYGAGMDIGSFEVQPDEDLVFRDFFEASPCP